MNQLRRRRNQAERDALIEQYLPLVRHVVARMPVSMPAMLDTEDFWSAGVMGLMHAAETWDPERGASFKTFAYTAIRGAVLDEIRRLDPVPRSRRERLRRLERQVGALKAELGRAPTLEELAEALETNSKQLDEDLQALATCRSLSLDQADGEDDPLGARLAVGLDDPAALAEDNDTLDRLAELIEQLPDPDRKVIVLYHRNGLYLKEIGKVLGVTESRVSQILTRATARLRLGLERDADD